jgi:fructokinase
MHERSDDQNAPPPIIVGLGEALFDVFPAGPRLGGAPLNVAVHSHRLLRDHGGRGEVVSRVGDDELGQRVFAELRNAGLSTDCIQTDPDAPTGRVEVHPTDDGGHTFHIAPHSAYDHLEFQQNTAELASRCAAVAFGCLAQRESTAQRSVQTFLSAAPQAIKLFDVNLRSSDGRDFYDAPTLHAGCDAADYVKLNDEELQTVCDLTGLADAEALVRRFNLRALIFTRGKDGTAALTADGWTEGQPARYDRVADADTVGAGDACSAGLLAALVTGHDLPHALHVANHMGAFVAGQVGATPTLPDAIPALLA